MKLLLEKWNIFLRENEDLKRVSKAVMFDDEGRVLILKRNTRFVNKQSPWEWDLPGGHIKKGESDVKGLQREIREETDLFISRAPDWFMLDGYTRFFVIKSWSGDISLSNEHTEYKWINPNDISNYNIGEVYEKAIQQAVELQKDNRS